MRWRGVPSSRVIASIAAVAGQWHSSTNVVFCWQTLLMSQ